MGAIPVTHVDPTTDTSTSNSYTKQVWADGDIITAEKLNHMEDGIANGGNTATPDWNENDDTSPSYIANRPFYSEPYLDEYIFQTDDPVTFTYIEDSQNGNHYLGTYTIDEIDSIDDSNTTFGIEISQGHGAVNRKIFSKYDMFSPAVNYFTTDSFPMVGIQRTISNSNTQYEIRFMSENIGDTIEAYVDFGTVKEDVNAVPLKYLRKTATIEVQINSNGSSYSIVPNNDLNKVDKLSDYLENDGYIYINCDHNIYTMINNSGTNPSIEDGVWLFRGDNGVFEYNKSSQAFTFYPLTAYINKNGNTYTCDISRNKLKYVEYIVYHETGTKMFADKSNTDITCQGVYCEMAGNTPKLIGMNFLINSSQVIANIKEY